MLHVSKKDDASREYDNGYISPFREFTTVLSDYSHKPDN